MLKLSTIAPIILTTLLQATSALCLDIGKTVPNFTAVNSHNQEVKLYDYTGKVVVLEWTNHECPFVIKHYKSKNMQNTQTYAREKGVVWLSIISSATGKHGYVNGTQANDLTQERNANPNAILLDSEGKIGKLFSARTTPHIYVIDAQQRLRYQGAIDDINGLKFFTADVTKSKNYVKNTLDQLLSGKEIEVSETKPYGCSIKYKS